MDLSNFMTPRQIVAELDKYIVGQHEAKRNVAIALRNRWRRLCAPPEIQKEIMPNNILMIGSTGVGKTEIARRLAKIADAPFVKVEASKFTEVGYVGRDVEGMVRDLMEVAVKMVKEQKAAEVKLKATEAVEEILLDKIIPPVESVDHELNERTREKFRIALRNGQLDSRKVEISIDTTPAIPMGIVGGAIDEASLINMQEIISSMLPKKNKTRKVTIAEARKILMEQESSKLIDPDEVKSLAIQKAENSGIIFIDEIDKIASSKSGQTSGPDVSREGVQRDLLPVVEGCTVNTKYGPVNTDHILFIAAGAFHISKPSDLIPELQGRFPIRVELEALTQADFVRILTAPENALTKQYKALFQAEGVTIDFTEDAIEEIAAVAFEINLSVENIGARRLHTVMSHLLNEFLFQVPDEIPQNSHLIVNAQTVKDKLSGLVKNRDLSGYIL